MNTKYIYLAGGFVAGLLIAVAIFSFAPQTSMMESIESKTGDDFDMAFIDAMIEHHEGAIDMANIAKTNAKHDEIKVLADNIIVAQTSEIEMMNSWKSTWYGDLK